MKCGGGGSSCSSISRSIEYIPQKKNSCEPIKKLDSFGNVYEVCPICGRNSKEENLYCPDCGTKFKRILMTLEIPL